MLIRKAKKTDVSTIWRLTRELAKYEKLLHVCKVSKRDINKIFFGKNPSAECYLIEHNGKIVGMGKLLTIVNMYSGKPFFLLRDFMVQERFRGQGYGKTFMEFAAKLAHKRGYSHIEWAVLDWNKPSINFYLKLGAISPPVVNLRLTGDRIIEIAKAKRERSEARV